MNCIKYNVKNETNNKYNKKYYIIYEIYKHLLFKKKAKKRSRISKK